jgi:hypothetical protein
MTRRPPPPDLDSGDRVLIAAHRWRSAPGGNVWVPIGEYRWRVVERLAFDTYVGWCIWSTPTRGDHPSREIASEVVSVVRPGGEHRPPP